MPDLRQRMGFYGGLHGTLAGRCPHLGRVGSPGRRCGSLLSIESCGGTAFGQLPRGTGRAPPARGEQERREQHNRTSSQTTNQEFHPPRVVTLHLPLRLPILGGPALLQEILKKLA